MGGFGLLLAAHPKLGRRGEAVRRSRLKGLSQDPLEIEREARAPARDLSRQARRTLELAGEDATLEVHVIRRVVRLADTVVDARARPAYGSDGDFAGRQLAHAVSHLLDTPEALVPEDEVVISGRRRAVLRFVDLAVGAVDADAEDAHEDAPSAGHVGRARARPDLRVRGGWRIPVHESAGCPDRLLGKIQKFRMGDIAAAELARDH